VLFYGLFNIAASTENILQCLKSGTVNKVVLDWSSLLALIRGFYSAVSEYFVLLLKTENSSILLYGLLNDGRTIDCKCPTDSQDNC
jgi:hypothetical protein